MREWYVIVNENKVYSGISQSGTPLWDSMDEENLQPVAFCKVLDIPWHYFPVTSKAIPLNEL